VLCEALAMKGKTQIDPVSTVRCLPSMLNVSLFCSIFLLFWGVTAKAQSAHPPYGATSAQDQAKRAATAIPATTPVAVTASADPADQVCARFAAGAVVSAPPELKGQNGVLEVTFTFQTATDSQEIVRYCYVTNTGLEAPTLRVIGNLVYHCHILQHEDQGMMAEIQVLPSGSASATTMAASASSIAPNGNVTLTANVVDSVTGNATPTGSVQFQIDGNNVGNPVMLANGQATLTAPVDGAVGSNSLTAFYQGDGTYMESASAAIPLTVTAFALSSKGTTAAVGAAAIASVTVNVANGYTTPISLTCTMPATLTESACFVDPGSITGTGQVSLTVNTTPAHPQNSKRTEGPRWYAASGGPALACVFLLTLPRRRWRGKAMLVLSFIAVVFTAIGCDSGTPKTDPGTAKGNYTVVVTGTTGSGASQFQTTVNVPITVQ
jgi:hypothetical protein